MINLFGQFFKRTLLFVVLIELISLFAFLIPQFMPFAFWILVGLFFIISLWGIEHGLYLLLAELFIGSKGYLFFYEVGGLVVSMRIALFLIFLAICLAQVTTKTQRATKFKKSFRENKRLITYYLLLITFVAIGLVNGLLKDYSFNNIFFDFNAWLYLALFLPFLDLITRERVEKVLQIFIAAATWISIKTILVLYFFSHQFFNLTPFYRWLRDSGVGEITMMSGNFYRVFFQSQIYVLIGFLLLFVMLIFMRIYSNENSNFKRFLEVIKGYQGGMLFLFLCFYALMLSCLIISFSRSFWAGLIGGLVALFLFLKFQEKFSWVKIFKACVTLLLTSVISTGIIFGIMKLPPKTTNGESFASLVEKRVTTTIGEAAGSSRINLLKPLLRENLKYPILGAGFGAAVTYKSSDPRIKTNLNPEGWYTTYAFEWGYLDIWLKIGMLGLAAYLLFILKIIKEGLKKIKGSERSDSSRGIYLGLLMGLVVLLITNIFSPYLNHPLGIGWLLLCAAIFRDTHTN